MAEPAVGDVEVADVQAFLMALRCEPRTPMPTRRLPGGMRARISASESLRRASGLRRLASSAMIARRERSLARRRPGSRMTTVHPGRPARSVARPLVLRRVPQMASVRRERKPSRCGTTASATSSGKMRTPSRMVDRQDRTRDVRRRSECRRRRLPCVSWQPVPSIFSACPADFGPVGTTSELRSARDRRPRSSAR